jgi:ATP synthase protein I
MPDPHEEAPVKSQASFSRQVGAIEARKIKARNHSVPSVWAGLGTMGLIGWSVTMPTLLFAALGIWLQHHYPARHNWTLALIVVGLSIGCSNAWRRVSHEIQAMQDRQEDADE